MESRAAMVIGGSGSVGRALIEALVKDGAFESVISFTRRPSLTQLPASQATGGQLLELVVPVMTPDALQAAVAGAMGRLRGDVCGLSALGVGAGTAKLTLAAHRAVDVDLNASFARALAQSGRVAHFALLSAVGANPLAPCTGSGAAGTRRYARVKGEAEEAVKQQGVAVASIFRPSTLLGSQHTPWLMSKAAQILAPVTPTNFRPISVEQVARAMLASCRHPPAQTAVYHYAEMLALCRE